MEKCKDQEMHATLKSLIKSTQGTTHKEAGTTNNEAERTKV